MSANALSNASPYGLFGGWPDTYACGAATDPIRKSGYVPPYTSRPAVPMTGTVGAMPYRPRAIDARLRSPAASPLMITPSIDPFVGIRMTYGARFGSFSGTAMPRVMLAPRFASSSAYAFNWDCPYV